MPLKQGTETLFRCQLMTFTHHNKKDAPKAGDGNYTLPFLIPYLTTANKKDAPKAGDGNTCLPVCFNGTHI